MKKWVVHFVISDTWADKFPDDNRKQIGLGTEFFYVVDSLPKACSLANRLVHLVTGVQESIFSPQYIRSAKLTRYSWSNPSRTHHCEITPHFELSSFTKDDKQGVPNE